MSTSIRQTLKKLSQTTHSLNFTVDKPELLTIANQLIKQAKTTGQPQPRDLKSLHQTFFNAAKHGDWSAITTQQWRQVIWLLWYGKKAQHLAQYGELFDELWNYVLDSPILLKRMIRVYFYEFSFKKTNIDKVGYFIEQALKQNFRNKTLQNWKKQHKKYRVFEPELGVQLLTEQCLKHPPLTVLTDLGFKGELINSEYVKTLYQNGLQQIIKIKKYDLQTLDYILSWSEENNKLRYPDTKRKLIQALLTPWQHADPQIEIKQCVQYFLIKHFQDPRTHNQSWHGVANSLMHVIYRWLIGTTLETFIEILDQCVLDKHWQYRRAFWWAYYERECIDEAWLVLGSAAQNFLQNNPELHEMVQGTYANLIGTNIRSNHCVLLFKIKELIVAEWSHQGRCHIWFADSEDAPQFYASEYSRDAVTQNSEKIKLEYNYTGISHHNSETGGWQADIAAFIAEHTDISIQIEDYMPT